MGRGLTDPARDAAFLVEGRTGSPVERAAAVEAIAAILAERGRTVTTVESAASPAAFDTLLEQARAAGGKTVAPNVSVSPRTWPTAEGRRRGDATWEALGELDRVERRLAPRHAVRLLPFVFFAHDSRSMADSGEAPAREDVPATAADPAAALRAMRDAWATHRGIAATTARARGRLEALAHASRHVFAFALHGRRDACAMIVLERPSISLEDGLLHSWRTPAITWLDGSARWYWRGVELPESLVRELPGIRAEDVAQLSNAELRRLAVEYMGVEHFLRSAQAERSAQDDFGTLWRTGIRIDGEPFVAVEVVNSTAEPDGSYRRYFLRVPPETETAREAVAWTFGFDAFETYAVAAET
jgi:Domain of unknown function (DUF6745)